MGRFYQRMDTKNVRTPIAVYEPVRSLDQQWFGYAPLENNTDVEDSQ